ncbi:MAG TPA: gliding motility lipoprotein GldH [Cyclobacteriaceae bacterium]|nr:gliding motility lipoprotein GldH [Cyclobacteriaceae bacterium]
MKWLLFIAGILLFTACDPNRVYEQNVDFEQRQWSVSEQPQFEFTIDDTTQGYNLYANIRNEVSYPNANLYFTYYLNDTTGKVLAKKLVTEFLFDKKTGRPFGSSVLGDIYNHRFPILKNYSFQTPGKYSVRFEQFMRSDTLEGILSVGLRVERNEK